MVSAEAYESQVIANSEFLSEEDFEALGEYYEIIDGHVIERTPMSTVAVVVRDNIQRILDGIVMETKTGYLFGDGVIYLMWKTERGLKGAFMPDVSFIRAENVVADWDITLNYPGVPDLAVEVVSPTDLAEVVMTKARRYLERGTEQLWLVFPALQEVYMYRRDTPDTVQILRGEATLDAGAFFPGVQLSIAEFFKLPKLE